MSAPANDEAAEVAHWSDVYEAALLRHDVDDAGRGVRRRASSSELLAALGA